MSEAAERGKEQNINTGSSYKDILQKEGVPIRPSENILNKLVKISGEAPNSLTGIPVESQSLRALAARELGFAIREKGESGGHEFAVIMSDMDNLKVANNIDHEFGDVIIGADAAMFSSFFEGLDNQHTKIFLMRPSAGADEIVTIVTGLQPDELRALQEKIEVHSHQTKKIQFTDKSQKEYTMSASCGMITSLDEDIDHVVERINKRITAEGIEDKDQFSERMYQHMRNMAEDKAMLTKAAKDVSRLDIIALGSATTVSEITNILTSEIGNTRISEFLQIAQLEIFEKAIELIEIGSRKNGLRIMWEELEMDDPNKQRLFSEEDVRALYFDKIMNDIYDELRDKSVQKEHEEVYERRENFDFTKQLDAQGVLLKVPATILDTIVQVADEKVDEKTGLPIETESMRNLVLEDLKNIARLDHEKGAGDGFILAISDLDNLKTANLISHEFGDTIIQADGATFSTLFGGVVSDPAAKVYLMRQTSGADEIVAFVTGLKPDEMKALKEKLIKHSQAKKTIDIRKSENKQDQFTYVMTSSIGIVTSEEPETQARLRNARAALLESEKEGESMKLEDLYRAIKSTADERVKIAKMAKDLGRLDIVTIGTADSVHKIKEIFIKEFSGTRVSRALQLTQLEILNEALRLNRFAFDSDERAQKEYLFEQLDIPNDVLRDQFEIESLRVLYFNKIMYDIYDDKIAKEIDYTIPAQLTPAGSQ